MTDFGFSILDLGLRFRMRFCLSAAMVFLAASAVFAQKETPPVGGQPKPFVFPAQENFTLPNGMKVTLVQYGSVPKVAIQAYIYTGTKDDSKGKKGVSQTTADMLKEGTKTRTSEEIARSMAEMGGSLNVGAGTDNTVIGGEVLSEFDVRFLTLVSDVIMNPNFRAGDLERLRANKLRQLAVASTQAQNVAWERFREMIFPDHPYGQVNPTESEVKSYTLDDIRSFHLANYGAARTHLYIVGKFNAAAVRNIVEKAFSGWKAGAKQERNPPKTAVKRSFAKVDRPGAQQSTLYVGMPAPDQSDPDYVKFVVMDSILGGAFGSRITSNIREDKGYTYSPGSAVWTRYKTGYWYESADVKTENTGDSIKEILFEVNRMRTEPVSEAELQGIKNNMVGIYVLQNSSRFGVIGQLETMNYHELPKSFIDDYVKRVVSVTAADVQAMAKKYLTEDRMTIVVVGDLAKVNDQLKPYE
ncbi:MAG: insulinase family protein [Acidobacteria bacterium]|nr:insulinase family protein [Acidobacteriota bacterium]